MFSRFEMLIFIKIGGSTSDHFGGPGSTFCLQKGCENDDFFERCEIVFRIGHAMLFGTLGLPETDKKERQPHVILSQK